MVWMLLVPRRCLLSRVSSGEYNVGSVPAKGLEAGALPVDD
jgi:hypothetical protein